jgi:P4 family phage/plasmid primase-like protien
MIPEHGAAPVDQTEATRDALTVDSTNRKSHDDSADNPQLEAALAYYRLGWSLIELPYGKKFPGRSSWQHDRHDEDSLREAFGEGPRNIGVLLGPASDNLVDCDQDHPLWAQLASAFLPETAMRFGRPGKPGGHRLYRCDPLPRSEKFVDSIPVAEGGMGTIGEIRAQANQLTVLPNSFHEESGETVTWEEEGERATVSAEDLRAAYAEGCAAMLLWHHWPGEHARHEPALALAGGLLRAGWEEHKLEGLLRFLWPSADAGQIEGVIRTTAEKLAEDGAKVTGWKRLEEHLNPAVVRTVRKWLGISSMLDRPPLTDLGNAERFIARHGKDVLYCALWGKWLIWDGHRWLVDEKGVVREWGNATIRAIPDEVRNETDPDKHEATLKWALASEQGKRLDTMLTFARSIEGVAVSPDELDRHPWLLNVANGTLDLRTLELREARREDLLTKVMPVAYLPEATCPLWEGYVRTAMSQPSAQGAAEQPEMEAYLQQLVGYMLTGDISEKMLPLAYDPGDTGKTTFTEILLDLFGDDYGMTASESTIAMKRGGNDAIPNDVAALRAARLVVVSETSQGLRLNEGRIKAMTGRNRIPARFLNQEWFSFVPEFKLIIETNHRPQIGGTDTAIWNRIKLIPFLNVLPKEHINKTLPDRLRGELPGILNWALAGCAAWREHGLVEPNLIKAANSEYRDQSDRLREFLAEECDVSDPTAMTRSSEIYRLYNFFAELRGQHPMSDQRFSEVMKERGFVKKERKGIGYWVGIKPRVSFPRMGMSLSKT